MVHEIGANGVVSIQSKRDLQFRSDAIDARDQHRLVHAGKVRREEPAEAADSPKNFGTVRAFNAVLDAALYQVAEFDVDAGEGVSLGFLVRRFHRFSQIRSQEKSMSICATRGSNFYFRSANNVGCAPS